MSNTSKPLPPSVSGAWTFDAVKLIYTALDGLLEIRQETSEQPSFAAYLCLDPKQRRPLPLKEAELVGRYHSFESARIALAEKVWYEGMMDEWDEHDLGLDLEFDYYSIAANISDCPALLSRWAKPKGPDGEWVDSTYHNDSCASMAFEVGGEHRCTLYVYPPVFRDFEGEERFNLYDEDGNPQIQTDSLSQLVEHLAKLDL